MTTDNVQFAESLIKTIEYSWQDEMSHLLEETGLEHETDSIDDDLDRWIKWCNDNNYTNHIFYHLMILKSGIPDNTYNEIVNEK